MQITPVLRLVTYLVTSHVETIKSDVVTRIILTAKEEGVTN
jgi:hypothetical protein